MNEKISVVLPTYNGEKSIKKSIESVLNQTYTNWELIIVNDCSTDDTLLVAQKYASESKKIKLISNTENQKLPNSLNIGFSVATGDYLTWTSDDNAFHPNAFETMMDAFNDNPSVDLVYSDFDIVDLEGNLLHHQKKKTPDFLRYYNVVGACFLYKKTLARKIGEYDHDLFLAEDYEYWLRAYLSGKLLHLEQTLYDYGWHDKSLTVTRKLEIGKATFKAKNKHFEDLLNLCQSQKERNVFFDEMLNNLTDVDEKKHYRQLYYHMDKKYAMQNLRRRVINKVKTLIHIK